MYFSQMYQPFLTIALICLVQSKEIISNNSPRGSKGNHICTYLIDKNIFLFYV